jgi:hypothetical protein
MSRNIVVLMTTRSGLEILGFRNPVAVKFSGHVQILNKAQIPVKWVPILSARVLLPGCGLDHSFLLVPALSVGRVVLLPPLCVCLACYGQLCNSYGSRYTLRTGSPTYRMLLPAVHIYIYIYLWMYSFIYIRSVDHRSKVQSTLVSTLHCKS